jgi:hypothetical protein
VDPVVLAGSQAAVVEIRMAQASRFALRMGSLSDDSAPAEQEF